MSKCGLSIHQSGKDHNDTFYLYTVLENDFGEKRESSWPVCKSEKEAQKKCADATLISRHAAMRILGLSATDDDHDGNDITDEAEKEPYAPPGPPEEPIRSDIPTVVLEAVVNYEDRNKAKTAGFKFDSQSKRWLKEIAVNDGRLYPFEVREL